MNDLALSKIRLMVSGKRACFRRPELSADLITYDVMPPTVARQLLKSVLGDGGWLLDRITVCNPIHFRWDHVTTARGNRRALVLTDVVYVLDAHIAEARGVVVEDKPLGAAHLGLVNYPADVRLLTGPEPTRSSLSGTGRIDLGWMTYDSNRSRTRFFRASMLDGVIAVGADENLELAS